MPASARQLAPEALIDAGVHMGFPHRIAEKLVLKTIKGSAAFYQQANRHPAQLRNQVNPPGGTSAEASDYAEQDDVGAAVPRANVRPLIVIRYVVESMERNRAATAPRGGPRAGRASAITSLRSPPMPVSPTSHPSPPFMCAFLPRLPPRVPQPISSPGPWSARSSRLPVPPTAWPPVIFPLARP